MRRPLVSTVRCVHGPRCLSLLATDKAVVLASKAILSAVRDETGSNAADEFLFGWVSLFANRKRALAKHLGTNAAGRDGTAVCPDKSTFALECHEVLADRHDRDAEAASQITDARAPPLCNEVSDQFLTLS